MRKRRIVIKSVSGYTVYSVQYTVYSIQYFFTLSDKRHDFRKKKVIEHKKCFDFLLILSETFLILRIIERDMIKKYNDIHVKYLLFLLDFNEPEISYEIF